jgi:aminopeptidase
VDVRTERLAKLLVGYSVDVQPGESVAIMASPLAADLVRGIYEQILRQGGHPLVYLELPGVNEIFFRCANEAQLKHINPVEEMVIAEFDALIKIRSAANTRELSEIDPQRQTIHSKARAPLLRRYMERGATGDLKWSSTLFPTAAYALEADMSLRDYEAFVYGACFCDREDPIAAWQEVHDKQARVIDWLEGKKDVKVAGPNADLTLSIAGRTFINSDGHHNMPSGEVYTGPVEDSANGWVRYTYPAVTGGRVVEGIELWFEDGEVVKATAKKNETYLHQMLETDEGARYLGEFAIGTNFGIQRFTKQILFDEKIGGSFHTAVGAGYPETGSQNRSAIHWDMICDMREGGEIWIDGELFYQNGKFVI